MNILITGIGGPTPRSIARQVRKVVPNARIIGVDANPKALGFFMKGLIDQAYVIPRSKNRDAYWAALCGIIEREQIAFAFVQPEREVIAWNQFKKTEGNFPCAVLLPPEEHAKALINKANMSVLLSKTAFIPKTVRISPESPQFEQVEKEIGYPCWIRASEGSGGLGSLKLHRKEDLEAWLFIHSSVPEFTVSEFLPGRHLANQMLYLNGRLVKNAGLECVEYVMADIAPSKVTGNTSFGRMLNDEKLLRFCEEVMDYVSTETGVPANGVYSFDLKENADGEMKVTEINVRHMAYTGIMAEFGFDLVGDTIKILTNEMDGIEQGRFFFEDDFIFLRDVDIEPILLREKDLKQIEALQVQ